MTSELVECDGLTQPLLYIVTAGLLFHSLRFFLTDMGDLLTVLADTYLDALSNTILSLITRQIASLFCIQIFIFSSSYALGHFKANI